MKGKEYSYPVKAYIYLVHLFCLKNDGKFKSVGCNKFTLFPIFRAVARSKTLVWRQQRKSKNIGMAAATPAIPVPTALILGVERSFPWLQVGKVSSILGKLQLGKVSVILGKERILSFPRMVKRKASKGERKGFKPSH